MEQITVEDVIKIFISYRGCRQGLFTDYGSVFDSYLCLFQKELKQCSLFEQSDRENTLAIRYRNKRFIIYSTDERAALNGIEYVHEDEEQATMKYLELYHLRVKK